jgi:hypothetical protein
MADRQITYLTDALIITCIVQASQMLARKARQ